jgi:hypothetical protein
MRNPKSEIRNSREIRNTKSEYRRVFGVRATSAFALRVSFGFPPSAFGLYLSLLLFPALSLLGAPRIGYVYPAGGQQGTSFEIVVGGQQLGAVTNAFISSAGVEAVVLDYSRPLTQREVTTLRDQLRELQERKAAATKAQKRRAQPDEENPPRPWTADDEKMIAEIRQKLAGANLSRNLTPAIAETVTLRVTVAPEAGPGRRELRVGTPAALSNPLVFYVGLLPEFSERPAHLEAPSGANARASAKPDTSISLPSTVNGQIMPGETDRFRFHAQGGERLVVTAHARALIPYLPDAVPGWFEAAVALYDSNGRELAFAGHHRFDPDPVLSYEIPAPGDYVIAIRDSIYRGREDFVYRLTMGELPFVTSIFPLGGRAGTLVSVELNGWNLPETTLTRAFNDDTIGTVPVSIRQNERLSNMFPIALDSLPEIIEQEPNDAPDKAQPVACPIIINGRIDAPGDWDLFRFEGLAGEEIVAEVRARRLNSPLDSLLKLTDDSGRQLAMNDDFDDKGSGLATHHADSKLSVILPADGPYYIHIGDAQQKGGPEHSYRLRISRPRPDFELRIVPSTISARPGSIVPITVYALRRDGFSGEIALALKDAPRGFALSGGWVPAGQDQVRITLTTPSTPNQQPASFSLEGRAHIEGREVIRRAVPAEDMMQAFAYRHLVPAEELKVLVAGGPGPRGSITIADKMPVQIPAGGTAVVRITAPPRSAANTPYLELNDPPEGIAIRKVSATSGGAEIVLQSDPSKITPGLKGNLILDAFGPPRKNTQGNARRPALGSLPAIPFEIVARAEPEEK